MKRFFLWMTVFLSHIAAVSVTGVSADERPSPDPPAGLSFRYGRAAEGAATSRHFVGKVPPVAGVVYVYATIHMGPANPINYVNGPQPATGSPISISSITSSKWTPAPTATNKATPAGCSSTTAASSWCITPTTRPPPAVPIRTCSASRGFAGRFCHSTICRQ